MKTIKLLTLLAFFIGFSSCSNDDDDPVILQIESELIENLEATLITDYSVNPPLEVGDYIKFSFESGSITESDTDWDIAFRGTKILVNGGEATTDNQPERTGNAGAYMATGTLATVTSIDTSLFKEDSTSNGLAIPTGDGNGWYDYAGFPTHAITPIEGRTLVFRTHDGKYAKVKISSYYKDSPVNPDSNLHEEQFYTFNYVYQPNEGVTTFE